jgi:peptide/nickel transport system permease protein
MWQYVFKRLLLMIPTVLGAAVVIFLLLRAMPGDVCEIKLGGEGAYVDEAQITLCRDQLGLNDSCWSSSPILPGASPPSTSAPRW